MTGNTNWRNVPFPDRMAHLEKDRRGFPIPFVVARDNAGEALFTINDTELTDQAIRESLCGICGGELEFGDLWWVGGPLSAFHPNGVFVDGPMHKECSTYALEVCPHLAAPRYTKRLDNLPGKKNGMKFTVTMDHTVMPDRPLVFIQARSISYDVTWPLAADRKLMPRSGTYEKDGKEYPRRWLDYEVWQFGVMLGEQMGIGLIKEALEGMDKQRTQAPKLHVVTPPEIVL